MSIANIRQFHAQIEREALFLHDLLSEVNTVMVGQGSAVREGSWVGMDALLVGVPVVAVTVLAAWPAAVGEGQALGIGVGVAEADTVSVGPGEGPGGAPSVGVGVAVCPDTWRLAPTLPPPPSARVRGAMVSTSPRGLVSRKTTLYFTRGA